MYCNHGKKSIYSLIAEAVTMVVVSSQVRGHLLSSQVLLKPMVLQQLHQWWSQLVRAPRHHCAPTGTLWFGTTWLERTSAGTDLMKMFLPTKSTSVKAKGHWWSVLNKCITSPLTHTLRKTVALYEVLGVVKIRCQETQIPYSGLYSFLVFLFEIKLLKARQSCWLSSHSNPRFHSPLKQYTMTRNRSLFYSSRVFPSN